MTLVLVKSAHNALTFRNPTKNRESRAALGVINQSDNLTIGAINHSKAHHNNGN